MSKTYWNSKVVGNIVETILPRTSYSNDCILEEYEFRLENSISEKIEKLCKKNTLARYIFFNSCIQILLYKILNNNCIITYTLPINQKNLDNNQYLPYVHNIQEKQSFQQLLLENQKELLELYDNQEDTEEILTELYHEHALSNVVVISAPLHQVAYENLDDKVMIIIDSEGLDTFKIVYNSCIFNKEYIYKLFVESLEYLSNTIVEQVSMLICDIQITSEDELSLILNKFNRYQFEYPIHRLHDFVWLQAKESPNNTAIQCREKCITYDELNNITDYLALKFINLFKTVDIVPILSARSTEMILSVLGILKAGKAFLPIDPNKPADMVRYILEDCKSNQILLLNEEQANIGKDITYISIPKLLNEYDGKKVSREKVEFLNKLCTEESLAYIIYTSGTTGKPKGVLIQHKSICNAINWRKREYKLSARDNVLLLLSFSFDGFVTSLFTPLASGATVIPVEQQDLHDVHRLVDMIHNYKITHFISIPTMYREILRGATKNDLCSLEKVTLAGEKLYSDLVSLSKNILPDTEIINEYGPTENSVVSTICRNVLPNEEISIGHPIDNVDVYIVNQKKEILPIGIYGEIALGGKGIAKGYLNNEKATQEKFVNNPFRANETMYLTGDLGRWLPDGNIDYLGRKDNQIKLNGIRIELEEIEKKFIEYPLINEAVVLFDKKKKVLLAYYTSSEEIDITKFKEYLKSRLIPTCIPSYMKHLEKIPVLPNGKIARNQLLAMKMDENSARIRPTNEVETAIYNIWAKVLENKEIGIYDKFNEVGGNSMLLTQVYKEIEELYPKSVSIMDLFTYSTIQELAKFIIQQREKEKKLEWHTIPLPNSFLYQSNESVEEDEIKLKGKNIVHDSVEVIYRLAEEKNIAVETVLLTISLYLFHSITEKQKITVYTLHDKTVKEISVDFDGLNTLEEVFEKTEEQLNHFNHYCSLTDIKEEETNPLQNGIVVLCQFDTQIDLNIFKLTFNFKLSKDELLFDINYDETVLKTSYIRQLLEKYNEILKQVINNYR